MKKNIFKIGSYRLYLLLILQLIFSYGYTQIIDNGPVYDDLQSRIENQFGPIYKIDILYKMQGIVDFGTPYPTPIRTFDPYETLKDYYLFIAEGITRPDQERPKGFWGMYRDGQIIWQSEPVIFLEPNSYCDLFAGADLNNDGNVEVIIRCSISLREAGIQWLWIFSWDGMTGNLITQVDAEGQSTIVSLMYVAEFDFADVDADGIWEIQGTWKDEHVGGERLITYGWNGQLYGKWPGIPQPDEDAFLPRNAVDAKVQAIITRIDSVYIYKYILENLPTSIQDINEFNIDRKIDSVKILSSKTDWRFFRRGDLFKWRAYRIPSLHQKTYYLTKGQISDDFKFASEGLPTIARYYVRGFNNIPLGQHIPLNEVYNDIFRNSVIGLTVVPTSFPDSLNTIDFLDSLIYFNQMSDSIGWISDSPTASKYTTYFQNAKSHIQQNNNPAAIAVLDSVLADVEADSGVTLSSEAYALIKYNTEYLKEQLLQSQAQPHNVRLLNSQGQLLPGGNLHYYDGGWIEAIDNGDGTFQVNTARSTLSLRMTYAYADQTLSNVSVNDSLVTFQTVAAQVELRNSSGELIDEGTVQYYSGAWRDFGVTSGGTAVKELLPKNYNFRMSYAFASSDKQQDINADATVVFSTVLATVNVTDQSNQPLNGAATLYYSGAWRTIGNTVNGSASMELLPKSYTFRASFSGAGSDKQQDISTDPEVNIQLGL